MRGMAAAAAGIYALGVGMGAAPAQAQPAGESSTPAGCHWVDVAGAQQHLWCPDSNGRFFDTGRTHSSAATADSVRCPPGLTFDGAECIGPPVARPPVASAPAARAAPPQTARANPPPAPAPAPARRTASPAASAPNAAQLRTARAAIEADAGFWAGDTRLDRGSLRDFYAHTTGAGAQRVHATFTYNQGKAGWADAQFENGVVRCIEYFDTEGRCIYARSPEDKERYEKEHPPVTLFDLFTAPSGSTECTPAAEGDGSYRGRQYCR